MCNIALTMERKIIIFKQEDCPQGHSIPLWIEIFGWRVFLARPTPINRFLLAAEAQCSHFIMPEKESRQKPEDYTEDTTQLLIYLLKTDPKLKLKSVQDKLRRTDNNKLCFPESWRVSHVPCLLCIIIQSWQPILTFLVFC